MRLVIQLDVIHGDQGHPGILRPPRQHSNRRSVLCPAAAPCRDEANGPFRAAMVSRLAGLEVLTGRLWPTVWVCLPGRAPHPKTR